MRARKQPPPRAELEIAALQAFRRIYASSRCHDADVRRITGISGSQLWALSEVVHVSAMSVNDLSERMALHQTTTSNLVNALVERKLVRRERDAADQRIVRLHATADGKRMLLRAPGPYTGLLVDALRNLDASNLRVLEESLARLLDLLRGDASEAGGRPVLGE